MPKRAFLQISFATFAASMAVALPMSAGATPSRSLSCGNYKAASVSFSKIKLSGVTCAQAHSVLGSFVKSAATTDLGFKCRATKLEVTNSYSVTCAATHKNIVAVETR